jgi:hypothetical protein
VFRVVSAHAEVGEWEIFLSYVRFYLLEGHSLVFDPAFDLEIIDNLVV